MTHPIQSLMLTQRFPRCIIHKIHNIQLRDASNEVTDNKAKVFWAVGDNSGNSNWNPKTDRWGIMKQNLSLPFVLCGSPKHPSLCLRRAGGVVR